MNILRTFGIGNKSIIEQGKYTTATVIDIKKCWWIKINKKLIRISGSKYAEYPNIITFTYTVDGIDYNGKRDISSSVIPPHINETILIYYNESNPKEYAVEI